MKLLTYDDALAVIRRLVDAAHAAGEPLGSPIVLVGGTAMAAWKVREHSNDIDLYVAEVPTETIDVVEREFRQIHGQGFRLDVTSGENVWGSILVRDIANSPRVGSVGSHELRALTIEDLFLLKLSSGRARDLADLDLLAPRSNPDSLIDRWNTLAKWHGDRHAILGFADGFVVHVMRFFGWDAKRIIARLAVTTAQRELLTENHSPLERTDGSG